MYHYRIKMMENTNNLDSGEALDNLDLVNGDDQWNKILDISGVVSFFVLTYVVLKTFD